MGASRSALRNYLFAFIRERARQRWKEEHVSAAARRRRRHAARSERADDRLRAPLHRLQAARADLPRPRAAGRASSTPRGGPVQIVFAGKAHPADETGKHHLQQVYRRAHRSDVRRPHRLRRRLRPARRALPRAGLRRLAEQPAQAARGERHERHEGVDQRRAAPEHRRRLVGGRLHRPERLADRRPDRRRPIRRRSTPPTPRRSINCSRHEVVPRFYDRDARGIPRRWLAIVRQAIISVAPRFSARRMVSEYAESMYGPALARRDAGS